METEPCFEKEVYRNWIGFNETNIFGFQIFYPLPPHFTLCFSVGFFVLKRVRR